MKYTDFENAFSNNHSVDTTRKIIEKALNRYCRMIKLLQWMDVNPSRLLYGLDHVNIVCNKIMRI